MSNNRSLDFKRTFEVSNPNLAVNKFLWTPTRQEGPKSQSWSLKILHILCIKMHFQGIFKKSLENFISQKSQRYIKKWVQKLSNKLPTWGKPYTGLMVVCLHVRTKIIKKLYLWMEEEKSKDIGNKTKQKKFYTQFYLWEHGYNQCNGQKRRKENEIFEPSDKTQKTMKKDYRKI